MDYTGASDVNFLQNAITNNTFDIHAVEKTLTNILYNSFNYLYDVQKNAIGLYRFNFTSEDFRFDEYMYMYLTAEKDIIEQYARKNYRTSKFFDKLLTLEDLNSNRDIFVKMPLVFINGLSTFDYKVKAYKDKTVFVFPYDKKILRGKYDITILYLFNNGYKEIKSNKYIIDKYESDLPSHFFGHEIEGENGGTNFAFLSKLNSVTGSSFNKINNKDNSLQIEPTKFSNNIIRGSREFNINIVNIRYIYSTEKEYVVKLNDKGEEVPELVVIENKDGNLYDMPIPTENMIILKYKKDIDEYIVYNYAHMVLHYPNIYEIKDEYGKLGDRYKVFYFYHTNTDINKFKNKNHAYFNLLKANDPESTSMEEAINRVWFNTALKDNGYLSLFDKYFNFYDYVYTYNHGDFFSTCRPNHFDYKVNKLKDFLLHDAEDLRKYVENQYDIGQNYYLWIKNIDLESRLRNDTSQESDKTYNQYIFDEPHYVFAFRNEGTNFLDLRFFIDGLMFSPKYHVQSKGLEYIYIPASIVTPTSYIEIEKFDSFVFRKTITFERLDQSIEINILNDEGSTLKPTLKDIYVSDNRTGRYIAHELFDITVSINKNDVSIREKEYSSLTTIKIMPKSESLFMVPLTVKVVKFPFLYTKESAGYEVISTKLPRDINRDKKCSRVFINGRLIPQSKWSIKDNSELTNPRITLLNRLKDKDVVSFDITPFYYEKIYSADTIPQDGIIDLKGFIDKPFDLRFYDMYINGRKLNELNIICLTPTKIKLITLFSLKNLRIYKKDRDKEYFRFDYENGYYLIPDDELLDDTENITEEDKQIIIGDIIDHTKPEGVPMEPNQDIEDDIMNNFNEGDVTSDDIDMQEWFEEEVPLVRYLNPDYNQFLRSTVERYPYMFRTMVADGRDGKDVNVIKMDPDSAPNGLSILKIDPEYFSFGDDLPEVNSDYKPMVAKIFMNRLLTANMTPIVIQTEERNPHNLIIL